MSLTTQDCKLFIAKNAKEKNVPSENWKRTSKTRNDAGWIRVFSHEDDYEIEISEKFSSSELEWLSTKKNTSEVELKNYSFSDLPNSVKLFVNTLRSLMGDKNLDKKSFDKKHITMWEETIKHRHAKVGVSLPNNF